MSQEEIPLENTLEDWRKLKFKFPKREIRLATLFSGIGAIEQALKRLKLKHKIIFAGDIDKAVKESYLANHNLDLKDWHDDITKFSAKKYQYKVDLLVGGSPCQSFSMVGHRGGLEDARGTLFYDFARVVSESKPKVFIFENVKGLLSHDKGQTWNITQEIFDGLGYSIFHKVLNSKDYGVPQNRSRVFVIGFRNKRKKFNFPDPIPLESSMQDYLEDYAESQFFLKEKGVKFVTSLNNQKKSYTQINGDVALCQKANQQFNWHGDFIFEKSKNLIVLLYFKLIKLLHILHPAPKLEKLKFDEHLFEINEVDERYYLSDKVSSYVLSEGTKNFKTQTKTDLKIARPLLQSMHKMHRAGVDNYVTHTGRIRKLTPRECLRLMGFRDDFKIVVSNTQLYRQAGNSIVVDVLIALLKKIDITKYGKDIL
jgi:DNA (cytosine-5)-methyltransferase 1